ncbi:hypothetical protein [Helicobacter sp.]|uniref:hypothetical protein n=1 Tax=Helicobacter sp. TaxID=218 RepID=UPI0025C0E384|nr:hypothetical protein [Helicobacter sp.]MCI5968564.1 hypothetical protein [Helicobacter sp.]
MESKKPWIVAGRTDGFGARMCAILNAMALAKLADMEFKFSWLAPKDAPFLSEFDKNLENGQVLIPFANLPLKDELFEKSFIEKYGVEDSYVGNVEQIPSYVKAENLARYKIPPFPLEFGWYSLGEMLSYDDMDDERYRELLKDCWNAIEFSTPIQNVMQEAKKQVKKLKKGFVAFHIRSGDIVFGDTWASVVCQKTGFSVYLAVEMARLELEKGSDIVIFSDDLRAGEIFKSIFKKDSKQKANLKQNGVVYCVDDFFRREVYLGYEQSIFEIVFMSCAKKICNGGSSGFSGLAMRIGNIKESVSPDDLWTAQEQANLIEQALSQYDFHPAHKAFAYMKLFLFGVEFKKDIAYLKQCAEYACNLYGTNFYKVLSLNMLLKSGDYAGANALLEQIYPSDRESFFKKVFESIGYGGFFNGIFFESCRVYDVENYPYLVYFAFRVGLFVSQLGEDAKRIPNYYVVLEYLNDYYRIANFLLKAHEMSSVLGGAFYRDFSLS